MEVAGRVLNLLLILVFVVQGRCAVPEIGKRHPDPIEIPVPDPIPETPKIPDTPSIPNIPDIPIVPVPKLDPVPNPGSNGPSPLGGFIDNSHQAPFSDRTGEWDRFFSKVDDILDAAATNVADDNKPNEIGGRPHHGAHSGTPTSITSTITDFCSPVVGGSCTTIPTYITVFDPAQPTYACSAWSSLSVYCNGGSTNCACYSSSYYVPDQWNSLAAACAKAATGCPPPQAPLSTPIPSLTLPHSLGTALKAESAGVWCDLVLSASSFTSYCPTNTSTVAFAVVTPTSTPTAAAPNASALTTTRSAATAIDVPKLKILTTALFLVLSAYRIW